MSKKAVNPRTGMDIESLKTDVQDHLRYTLAKDERTSTDWDEYKSVVLSVLDRLHHRWLETQQRHIKEDRKKVYYISMEYLIGRLLDNALINLGLQDEAREALADLGYDYDELKEAEWDAGLGNGGLGRLAACFLDSMATLGIAGYGYGIRYDFGIFYQKIVDGFQVEAPDRWLQYGNPWDVVRPHIQHAVHFYGESVPFTDTNGKLKFKWENTESVLAVAYDTPVPGYKNGVVNNLRLWKAESPKSLDLNSFNQGDYINAVRDMQLQENISRVLYPNDKVFVGQELRLKQEYFLVAATIADIVDDFKSRFDDWELFPEKVAIQCNDTHPNLAIPELMRILLDHEELEWEDAWRITTNTIAYTNHTILPEALEKWPVTLLRSMLPRHLQIIYEINNRFLQHVRTTLGEDINRIRRMSIIGEGEQPVVKMASLGIVGGHKVNGVSALHSDLLIKTIFKDYYELWPEKFTNMTNGITPRRWLKQCNPELSALISDELGDAWVTDLDELKKLKSKSTNKAFQKKFAAIKKEKKRQLAEYILEKNGVKVNPESIFDIQIKRIHEYKRQLMCLLHAIVLYNRIKADPSADVVPRTVIFGGKAAPGYHLAKMHIRLINAVGQVINHDPEVGDKLKVVFLGNYSVSLAERMIPAADLSEQISTAGMEASGTGNMKFALNGAITIGTLDGANVEIKEEVGDDNIIIFGNTVEDVEMLRAAGYNPLDYYAKNAELKLAIDQIKNGFFSPSDNPNLFHDVIKSILYEGDYFMVLADFEAYLDAQKEVEKLYLQPEKWNKIAIENTALVGKFSSDRTISDYATEIWNAL